MMPDPLRRAVRTVLAALGGLTMLACDGPAGPSQVDEQVASILVEAPDTTLWTGRRMQLAARVLGASGEPLRDQTVQWATSDTAVAIISPAGEVTGRTPGAVTFTATRDARVAQVSLRIVPPISFCSIATADVMLRGRTTRSRLEVYAQVAGRGVAVTDRRVTWSSSNPAVATVSDSGVVAAIASGETVISASCEGMVSNRINVFVSGGYDVVPLGTLGGDSSTPFDLNEAGDVVGEAKTASGETRAFLWRAGKIMDLGLPGTSVARGISEDGKVVGSYSTAGLNASYRPTGLRPFLWQNGTVTMLDPGAEEENVHATGVNRAGTVVGYTSTHTSSAVVGSAVYWAAGKRIDLGRGTGYYARLVRINESGQMLGISCTSDCESFLLSGGQRATIPWESTGLASNGLVAGKGVPRATPTNGAGSYLWENGGVLQFDYGRHSVLAAADVNSSKQIVGAMSSGSTASGGFLWSNGRLLVPDALLQTPGWRLSSLTGINDRGQIIGVATRPGVTGSLAVLLNPRP